MWPLISESKIPLLLQGFMTIFKLCFSFHLGNFQKFKFIDLLKTQESSSQSREYKQENWEILLLLNIQKHVMHRFVNKAITFKLYYTVCAWFVSFFEYNAHFFTILLFLAPEIVGFEPETHNEKEQRTFSKQILWEEMWFWCLKAWQLWSNMPIFPLPLLHPPVTFVKLNNLLFEISYLNPQILPLMEIPQTLPHYSEMFKIRCYTRELSQTNG